MADNTSISTEEFDYIRKVLREHSAIVLDEGKAYLAEARLGPLVRQEGLETLSELVRTLQKAPWGRLHTRVVEALATNETSFFRDSRPFESLKKVVIPNLVEARSASRTIRIWSAACATGQEPYSVAMLLREHFLALDSWNVEIIATDLSSDVLERAREGRYSQLEINRGLPAPMLVKYFVKDGTGWKMKDEIRTMVTFRQLNLVENWPAMQEMDVVLLRNVLIYFDLETRKLIYERLHRVIKPDGYLLLGGGETPSNLDERFKRVQCEKCDFYQLT